MTLSVLTEIGEMWSWIGKKEEETVAKQAINQAD
jgi:hypothetical protein